MSRKSGLGVLVNTLEWYLEKYNAQVSKQRFKTRTTFSTGNSAFMSWEMKVIHALQEHHYGLRQCTAPCVLLFMLCNGGRHAEAGAAQGV